MKSTKIIAYWLFFLLCSFTSLSAQNTIHINEGDEQYVGKNMGYFVDSTQKFGIHEVLNQPFITGNTEILNLGNTPHPVWMRFTVSSKTEKELFLQINAPLLSKLEVYQINGDTANQIFNGGDTKPFQERPFVSENWLLNLKLVSDRPTTIYLKGQSVYPFQVPIIVSSKNKFIENNQLHNLFWGIYMGIMLFAFIYNFFIYLSVRERYYLFYLLYIIASVAFYLGLEGFGFQFFWANSPGFNPLIPILVGLTNCIITVFALNFLKIDKEQKALYYWGWTTIIIHILISLLNLIGKYEVALPLSQVFSLFSCIYFIVLGIVSLKRGVSTAKYFLLAWFTFLVTVILFILALNNVVPSNFFTSHGIFIGHMTEVMLLSFALADRINALKKENENKQKEIIIQLEENQLLQTKVNRELEEKVRERTAEVVAQKERSDELLLNILPAEIAEELKAKGSADAKMIDMVTVLFTDIKGFTSISEKFTPQELVTELNHCFSKFDLIMQNFKIEKIKTIGDSYMAAGGLPTINNTNAKDVISASLEIQKFMQEYKQERAAAGKQYFEIRIGVHTGPVVAGIVGLKKFAYDIWGDTVNTASRMESSGEIGKINISQTTYDLVKNDFQCISRGKISAKGKGEMEMYFVES